MPIINKVSKLKEIKEEEDNEYQKIISNNIINNIMDNINNEENYEEEEKYKNILNKFKQEENNNDDDILYNKTKDEKPKLIRKNSLDKDKKKNIAKIISFEEFLNKENNIDE